MKNKQPKFSSNSDVKMSCTTKKRLEGTCPEFKNDCGCKEDKNNHDNGHGHPHGHNH